jgi:phosphosulfolactate synthase (CoM biosynthesis protein A)
MNNYIKHLVEAFDFNSVNKQNKKINAVYIVLQYIRQKIDNRERLSKDEYDILKKSVGIYKVLNHDELQELIKYFIKRFGKKCNLNWIDVSNVTDMGHMFKKSAFNGDIS